MADPVEIFEVGPRDGLQNEAALIPTADKIAFVNRLSDAGFKRIEVGSFVSPKWVPQMADSADVMAGITRNPNVSYACLTPNMKGLERAFKANANEFAIFGSASEGFSRANINCSIDESLDRFRPVAKAALEKGIPVRGYVSCVVACPYDGAIDPKAVARVASALIEMGCYEISLGDTIGAGTPASVSEMLDAVQDRLPDARLAGHFHDTNGQALENIDAALAKGLRVFDAASGGLGGCPYAPGSKGNVATESVCRFLEDRGHSTGLLEGVLTDAAAIAHRLRTTRASH